MLATITRSGKKQCFCRREEAREKEREREREGEREKLQVLLLSHTTAAIRHTNRISVH